MDEEMQKTTKEINYESHRYPLCLVWTPIPMLTWLMPFIGHLGIATSSGVIRDFAGKSRMDF
jgi:transmembrane protein 222